MQTVEIPREAWVHKLNEFTRIHEGWLVSLDVLAGDFGAQPQIDNLPLLGVSADRIDQTERSRCLSPDQRVSTSPASLRR